jgi:hypothetical protein
MSYNKPLKLLHLKWGVRVTKISSLSIYQQWTDWEIIKEKMYLQ